MNSCLSTVLRTGISGHLIQVTPITLALVCLHFRLSFLLSRLFFVISYFSFLCPCITDLQHYGAKLQSWTKVLGQIYFCGAFFTRAKQSHTNSPTPVQPPPHLTPTILDTCTRYFSRVSTFS